MALPLPLPAAGAPIYYSAAMVDALNEAVEDRLPRYECVYGELFATVSPPRPWHAALVERLHRALIRYTDREPAAGYVSTQPVKFTFGRADVYTSPDVWAVRTEDWRAQDFDAIRTPLLIAEVLSKRTRRRDRFAKRRAYLEGGTPLYWVVDGDERWVEVWTPALDFPRVEREQLVWHPDGAREPFLYTLADLFAPV